MSTENAFTMAGLRGFLYLVASEGLDFKKVLLAAQIQETQDTEATVSQSQMETVAKVIETSLPKAAFFRSIMRVKPGDFGVHGYALRHSKTLGEAMSLLARYHRLSNQSTDCYFDRSEKEGLLTLSCDPSFASELVRLVVESWLLVSLALMRAAMEGELTPAVVGIPYPRPVYAPELEAILKCPLLFSVSNAFIKFSSQDLERSFVGVDRALQGVVISHCESMLSKLAPRASFSEKVRRLLVPLLQHGTPSIEEVAKKIGMSQRTFQRRLGEEGTSFRELVEKTQEELAVLYLKQSYVTVSELAYLLGFSTHAAFHKAFRRWTNETPGDFRKRHLARVGES